MIANYHTHTRWCNHGIGEIHEFIEAAIKAGLEEIAMTEHVPHRDSLDKQRMRWDQFEAYNKELDAAITKYQHQIKVIKGFECEYYLDALADYKMFLEDYGYEVFILGQHTSMNRQIDNFGVKGKKELKIYADEVCEALSTGIFTFIAHPDLVLEGYNNGQWDASCEETMRQIFAACEQFNVPVEINANGLRGTRRYPDINAWKLSRDYKLKYLINADAHKPQFVCDEAIAKAEKMAESLGIQVMSKLERTV